MKVVADTSFLSSLAKIDRIDLINEFFDRENFSVPEQVIEETRKSEVYDLISDETLEENKEGNIRTRSIQLDYSELDYSRGRYGKGEIACIEIVETGDILLIDDRDAKELAENEGCESYDLPTFLLACKKKDILDNEEISEIIESLETEDHYQFSDDVEERLINNDS